MNLTPEQLELLLCLLGALVIGFLFGYLLASTFSKNRYGLELEEFGELLDTRDREIESASARYGQLKQHMELQTNELYETNQKIEDAQGAISKFDNNLKHLTDEKNQFESLLLEKDMRISELNEEVGFSKNELQDIQNLLNEYKNVNDGQNEKLLTANNEIEQNVKLSHALVKKGEEQTEKLEVFKEERETLANRVQMLTESIKKKDNDIGELKKQSLVLNKVKLDNQALKEEIARVSKSLEESRASNNNIVNEKYSALQREYEDVKKVLVQKDVNIANLEKNKEEASVEIKRTKEQQAASNNELQKELQNIKKDLASKDTILKSTEDRLQLSEEESKKIHTQLQKKISTEQVISQLSDTDNTKDGWDFTKILKGIIGDGDHNKKS